MHDDLKVLKAGVSHDDPMCFLLSMHPTTPASFQVSVDGNVAQAVYDLQLPDSFVSVSYCDINHLPHCFGVCNSAIAVELHTGQYFSCVMKLKI